MASLYHFGGRFVQETIILVFSWGALKKKGVRDWDSILDTNIETSSVRFVIIASYIINMFFTFNFNFPAAPFNFEVGSSFRREARIVENSDC